MTSARKLDRAYRRAIYRVELQTGSLDFAVSVASEGLCRLLRSHGAETAAFLTACNPGSRPRAAAANETAHAALLAALSPLGHTVLPGVALDPDGIWPAEPSLLVLGIGRADATATARLFRQNALVWMDAGGTPELVWAVPPESL